jgi:hypothetical protein
MFLSVFITQSPKGIIFHTNIKSVQNTVAKQMRKINGVQQNKENKKIENYKQKIKIEKTRKFTGKGRLK